MNVSKRSTTLLVWWVPVLFHVRLNLVDAHSWVVKVGLDGGKSRGGTDGTDLDLQRYFCPEPSLEDCQPEPKHNIFLTPGAQRPCRSGIESNPRSQIDSGDELYMSWMGNGHANEQSDGTCVTILMAPYETDPDFNDFLQGEELADCAPYYYTNHEGLVKTDTKVLIPHGTPPGKYTVLWYWDFYPFYFSSCADIDVGPSSPTAPVSAPFSAPVSGPATAPVVSPPIDDTEIYLTSGCTAASLPTSFCTDNVATSSYCKSNGLDGCGRAVCHGDAHTDLYPCPSAPTGATPIPTTNPTTSPTPETSQLPTPSPTPSPSSTPTTAVPSPAPIYLVDPPSASDMDLYWANGCAGAGLNTDFCATYNGQYCKDYQMDSCGRSICQGDDFSSLDPCT
mmetsp:Transcript_25973/g.38037  ORF Transcript_25973/g.38037 Transcript_25973/m.38037 type:complete len:393 (-) Transcript_25973:199-1377(-)